jgi:branched-chain amino acid transport system permease protein
MFYGIGAYGVGIAARLLGPTWSALAIGVAVSVALSLVISLLIAVLSMRVKTIYYTMMTFAFTAAFGTFVIRASGLTGGDDGINFRLPEVLMPGFSLFDAPVLGVTVSGKTLTYYLVLVAAVVLVLALLRIVNSPFGKVIEAIRENELRADAIGYRTLHYRVAANCIAATFATLAGVLMALWLRYVGPQTVVSLAVILNILLIAVIGGLGTIYGAVVGVVVFLVAENYLQAVLGALKPVAASVPVLRGLIDPDRWLLWFGLAFVLSVYFFPSGVVGKLRSARKIVHSPLGGTP